MRKSAVMITKETFQQVRAMRADGVTAEEIANLLGISRSAVYKIGQGRYRLRKDIVRCRQCGAALYVRTCRSCWLQNHGRKACFTETASTGKEQPDELARPLMEFVSTRLANYLDAAGIYNVHDLLQCTCGELLDIRGVGINSLKLILDELHRMQFDTRKALQFVSSHTPKRRRGKVLSEAA